MRFDATRQAWIILAPERLLLPDDIAVAVLKLVDGTRSVATIAGLLASDFAAPAEIVQADSQALLQELADDGVIEDARPTLPPQPTRRAETAE